ncbi:MAG: hypothetical protein ABL933_14640 [Methyloglobulus sp.]|nr:hypothetical protein [Methyloglobulus sp.]
MFNFKSKKMLMPLFFGVVSVLLAPTLAQAELGGSGSKAANEAAEQRAARERKVEKKKHDAEAKKAAEGQPTETQTPAVEPKEEPAAK